MSVERADIFMASLGVEAYRVGGSVRDEVLGRRPKDADYMVRGVALVPLGAKIKATGAKLSPLKLRDGRTVGWRAEQRGMGLVEITLPRKEISTGPGHRDFEIVTNPDITIFEDAQRRDFTFNALYKRIGGDGTSLLALPNGAVAENIIDPLDGLDDLFRRRVRITHKDSFRDDPLRTLRALRFVATLGYDLEYGTHEYMKRHAAFVTGLTSNGYASGTILTEMSKLLMGQDAVRALRIARDTGVLGQLFPELVPTFGFEQESRYHDLTVDEHTFKALETAVHVDAPLRVRWALLFHDSGKPSTAWRGEDDKLHFYAHPPDSYVDHADAGEAIWRSAATRCGATKALREEVATLIRNHMVTVEGKLRPSRVRRARVKFGDDMLRDLYLHRLCDVCGKGSTPNKNQIQRLAQLEVVRREAQKDGIPATVKDLAINGQDCMEEGLEGRDIGKALHDILLQVVDQPTELTLSREWQLSRLT